MPDGAAASDPATEAAAPRGRAGEVARLFLKLGVIGFGGPAAHIALMEDEVVRRRRWLTREQFLDLLGATNLIPGPNSTEMAIHVGFVRAGWPGLVAGGACFILPAMLITMGLAMAYSRYGRLPEAGWILYGVKPVIIAVVVQAVWGLARKAIGTPLAAATALAVLVLALRGANEVVLLFAAALGLPLLRSVVAAGNARTLVPPGLLGLAFAGPSALAPATAAGAGPLLPQLALVFLKVGSILFGSGYVLLAFLRPDLVERTGWLTDGQLLDAVAVGQFTPGPVLTTATFVGYLLARVPGAIVATVAIFLPSFVFVALSSPLIPAAQAIHLGRRVPGRCECRLCRADGPGDVAAGTRRHRGLDDRRARAGRRGAPARHAAQLRVAGGRGRPGRRPGSPLPVT